MSVAFALTYLKSKYVSDWRPPTAFGTVLMIFCDNSNFSKKIYDVSSSGNSLNRFFDKSETKKNIVIVSIYAYVKHNNSTIKILL